MLRSLVKILFLVLLGAGFVGLWFWHDYHTALDEPLSVGDKPVPYVVEKGMRFRSVAKDLYRHGWWRHPRYFVLRVQQRNLVHKLKVGEYEIQPGMKVDAFIDLLVSGRGVQHPITIVEGWSFAQVRQALKQSPMLEHTLDELDDAAVMERLGLAGMHPEGRFFPDTYHVTRGTPDVQVLKRAFARMQEVMEKSWSERAGNLPYTNPDEALTMASIVEKETAIAAERPLIASVFVQRLKRGMKLQTDPTVIYGLGLQFDGNIRRKDLERDTPYNTYLHTGLPPTPIAMPSEESILAALHPAETETLYFVARGDGSHEFSKTLEEHNRAVAKYQLSGRSNKDKKQ